jgi:hypothetical protein
MDHLPITNNYLYLHYMCFILRDLKCYGALPQALEIIFEMQRKKFNEK